MRNKILGLVMAFCGGFIVAMNMAMLIPNDPTYEASWGKVAIGVLLAIAGYRYSR